MSKHAKNETIPPQRERLRPGLGAVKPSTVSARTSKAGKVRVLGTSCRSPGCGYATMQHARMWQRRPSSPLQLTSSTDYWSSSAPDRLRSRNLLANLLLRQWS